MNSLSLEYTHPVALSWNVFPSTHLSSLQPIHSTKFWLKLQGVLERIVELIESNPLRKQNNTSTVDLGHISYKEKSIK